MKPKPSSFGNDSHTVHIGNEINNATNGKTPSSSPALLFGFDMNYFSKPLQLLLCIFSIFFLFILYGYCQEWIFQIQEIRKHGMFITLVQFAFYSIFGVFEQSRSKNMQRRIPLATYILLAILTIATMGLSNTSLGYLNYPTQVIFKSSKLIPVMIGGVLIQGWRLNRSTNKPNSGKVYTLLDILSCILMTVGLILFTYADQTVSPNFDITGIILISLALCADAAIGNVQEKTLKKYGASNAELVLYSYGIGFLFIFAGHVVYGQLFFLLFFILKHPIVLFMLFLFSLTGYVGIQFVLHVVRTFGALLAVTVTTCRKAVTMVLSFLLFSKPFTMQYVWSGSLVLLGVLLNIYTKNRAKINGLIARFFTNFLPKAKKASMSNIV